jgi:hypothetical protein
MAPYTKRVVGVSSAHPMLPWVLPSDLSSCVGCEPPGPAPHEAPVCKGTIRQSLPTSNRVVSNLLGSPRRFRGSS